MQAIAPVTTAQLLAVGQEPLIKIEIYVNGSWVEPWVNLCDAPTERVAERLTDGAMEIWTSATNLTNWTELDAGGQEISQLGGIEFAKNLKDISLDTNNISDISALSELTKLERLSLGSNKINNISPLSKLTNLKACHV